MSETENNNNNNNSASPITEKEYSSHLVNALLLGAGVGLVTALLYHCESSSTSTTMSFEAKPSKGPIGKKGPKSSKSNSSKDLNHERYVRDSLHRAIKRSKPFQDTLDKVTRQLDTAKKMREFEQESKVNNIFKGVNDAARSTVDKFKRYMEDRAGAFEDGGKGGDFGSGDAVSAGLTRISYY